jgi:cellulose synthase/poly-beta-1,6-N-acetylglucosamine synthase-like glycosyltransferase
VQRLVLIDKKNGGKADALNACINLAVGDYIVSMDADTILEPDALLRAIAPVIMGHGKVVAVGGQIALCNGASVSSGRIMSMGIPKKWIARFQLVEYMRSFALGRTALSAFHSVLILSGAFALMRRDVVVAVGGFLTKTMRSRVGLEYCGREPHTVCEDMEVIVRLHRYLLDRGLPGEVVSLPFPVAWTEAPESYKSLGKQRARWFRGLVEVLVLHREMMFRKKYTHIGWFALPYQFLFEFLAPLLEFFGYLLLVLTAASGILSVRALVVSILFSQMVHVCLSTTSVLLSLYTERGSNSVFGAVSLFPFRDLRSMFLLLFVGIASNFGYRQYLIFWQLRGFIDFLRRKRGWDKFARKGFGSPVAVVR